MDNLEKVGKELSKLYKYTEQKQLSEKLNRESARKDIEELQNRFVTQGSINNRKVIFDELSVEMEDTHQKPMAEWLVERREFSNSI